jgi:hypothetical protein
VSKFDFDAFWGGYGNFAANSQKYTKEQAVEIFESETDERVGDGQHDYTISTAWVRWRAGQNEDCEPCVGWWLEYSEHKRSCPVWEFHKNSLHGCYAKKHF